MQTTENDITSANAMQAPIKQSLIESDAKKTQWTYLN